MLGQAITINGQPMTVVGVGPEGFDGTTLGAKPVGFVPLTMRDVLQPGARTSTFENRRSYWAYVFGRLKPGLTIEQASTALNVPYKAILNYVEAPLQVAMSDQTMAKFRSRPVVMVPGERGQSGIDRDARSPLTLLLAVTALVLLIALREHCQPAPCAVGRSCRRDGGSAVYWREQASPHHATAHGVVPAGVIWRRRWTARSAVDLEGHYGDLAVPGSHNCRVPSRLERAAGYGRGYVGNRSLVRNFSRATQHASQPDCKHQGTGRATVGRQGRRTVPHHAGDLTGRSVDGAPRVGWSLHEEPHQHQPRRPRPESGERGDLPRVPWPQWL